MSTHLGNGYYATMPRHENVIWEQLADDRLMMSLIADGHHLPPAVVKCLVRAKGVARTLLTCDAGPLAGSPPGRYREWGVDMEVLPDGKTVVAGTPYLAGSGHFTDRCVGHVMRMAGVTLAEACDMAAARPRGAARPARHADRGGAAGGPGGVRVGARRRRAGDGRGLTAGVPVPLSHRPFTRAS